MVTIICAGGSNPYLSSSPPRSTNSPFTLTVFFAWSRSENEAYRNSEMAVLSSQVSEEEGGKKGTIITLLNTLF